MGRLFRAILYLAVIFALAVVGYAFFGDMSPDQVEIRETVTLDANN